MGAITTIRISKITIILILCSILSACSDDDNARQENIEGRDLNFLILGNSITQHDPAPSIGWYGYWGMAASAPDKDFESILREKLTNYYTNSNVTLLSQNVSFWENNFNFNLEYYESISNREYDVIIIRLGENVSDLSNYLIELNNLIDYYKTSKTTKVIITGTVWGNSILDNIHQTLAQDKDFYYIPFDNFINDPSNYAYGLFVNQGVAIHPSDKGMLFIAETIFNTIKED